MIGQSEVRLLEMQLAKAQRELEELRIAHGREKVRADTAENILQVLRRTVSQLAMDMLK